MKNIRQRRPIQALVAVFVCAAVWLLAFGPGRGNKPVVPDSSAQFSLDLEVVAAADHDLVYAVEQRARPAYRIFEFDPATGEDRTVFSVPEDAIIYGIALSPDRTQLAVAYTEDFELGGSGLWLLDLTTDNFVELAPAESDVFLVEPEWAADGETVLVTHVDRQGEDEVLAVAEVAVAQPDAVAEPDVRIVAENAITPAVSGADVYFLTVGDDNARRSIGVIEPSSAVALPTIGDDDLDLDHLIAATDAESLYVAVLDIAEEPSVTLGTAADAHGNHNVASTWWAVDDEVAPGSLAPIVVYDAELSADGAIVYATIEGLSIGSTADSGPTAVIESRAIRFVTA